MNNHYLSHLFVCWNELPKIMLYYTYSFPIFNEHAETVYWIHVRQLLGRFESIMVFRERGKGLVLCFNVCNANVSRPQHAPYKTWWGESGKYMHFVRALFWQLVAWKQMIMGRVPVTVCNLKGLLWDLRNVSRFLNSNAPTSSPSTLTLTPAIPSRWTRNHARASANTDARERAIS